jgi:hypothetical protein
MATKQQVSYKVQSPTHQDPSLVYLQVVFPRKNRGRIRDKNEMDNIHRALGKELRHL